MVAKIAIKRYGKVVDSFGIYPENGQFLHRD
jgi:hypothetical protein